MVRRLIRRGSSTSARSGSLSKEQQHSLPTLNDQQPRKSQSLTKLAEVREQQLHCLDHDGAGATAVQPNNAKEQRSISQPAADRRTDALLSGALQTETAGSSLIDLPTPVSQKTQPILTVEEPTPDALAPAAPSIHQQAEDARESLDHPRPLPSPQLPSTRSRPTSGTVRRQSLVNSSNARIVKSLLDHEQRPTTSSSQEGYASSTFDPNTMHRKIWVKRPGASATLVQIHEDDLVDDVRDMILRKYANSLGRSFDAPDLTLRILPRDPSRDKERTLGPEEEICRVLDHYYLSGQQVDEALLIDIPQRRTPKPSPRAGPNHHYPYHFDEPTRPVENGTDYFGTAAMAHSPAALTTVSHDSRVSHATQNLAEHPRERAMAVALNTGAAPPLPSPGGRTRTHHVSSRPRNTRTHTSSPTTIANPGFPTRPPRQRHDSTASDARPGNPATTVPAAPPLPTPPAPEAPPTNRQSSTPPTPNRVSSPAPKAGSRKKRPKPSPLEAAASSPSPLQSMGLLDNSVPPINVLIVEDNIINLKLLEAFMKRLKVRWATAMNGRAAVQKWRAGGFHLVLMDIQLPIMSGLEATKEIRRLERVNGIGVFSASGTASSGTPGAVSGAGSGDGVEEDGEVGEKEASEEDRLETDKLFKSPVIIVALTASSLQSDRHEALAAGCNDFLTKPVNFPWLERKVKEWGCMQALIDFDGWRKWKHFSEDGDDANANEKDGKLGSKIDKKLGGTSPTNSKLLGNSNAGAGAGKRKKPEKEKERKEDGAVKQVLETDSADARESEEVETEVEAER